MLITALEIGRSLVFYERRDPMNKAAYLYTAKKQGVLQSNGSKCLYGRHLQTV